MKKHVITFKAQLDPEDDTNYKCKMELELDGPFSERELYQRMYGLVRHFKELIEQHLDQAHQQLQDKHSLN